MTREQLQRIASILNSQPCADDTDLKWVVVQLEKLGSLLSTYHRVFCPGTTRQHTWGGWERAMHIQHYEDPEPEVIAYRVCASCGWRENANYEGKL